MKVLLALLLGSASLPPGVFESLPSDSTGPINCPKPPKTITTKDGRIYECRPEEGSSPYYDVTPPDDKAHWVLPFGNPLPPPYGTATYHPPKDWPFRAILVAGNPIEGLLDVSFYVFDQEGVIIDSSDSKAIGDQMMEVRITGVRLWPSAQVFYRMIPSSKSAMPIERFDSSNRAGDPARYGFVVDGGILCPALSESIISEWDSVDPPDITSGKYLNGHCAETKADYVLPDGEFSAYYRYPGFSSGGNSNNALAMWWMLQRHDEPERPLTHRGQCYAFCDK
ncbi:MAG: hypothetical protein ACN6RG_02075 [Stenotrophomonas sp.]